MLTLFSLERIFLHHQLLLKNIICPSTQFPTLWLNRNLFFVCKFKIALFALHFYPKNAMTNHFIPNFFHVLDDSD